MRYILKLKKFLLYYNHIFHWKLNHYKSLARRKKDISNYLATHQKAKLQLGCGPHKLRGWLNTELYGSPELVPLNLLKKFPTKNCTFDFAYSEHVIEHFTFQEASFICQETFRIIKPGGVLRVATPNLEFLVNLYNKKKTKVEQKYVDWSSMEFLKNLKNLGKARSSFVINNFARAWGHKFIHDFESLKILLESCGFENIKKIKPGVSEYEQLKNVENHWKDIGKPFNILETIVVEAQKPF